MRSSPDGRSAGSRRRRRRARSTRRSRRRSSETGARKTTAAVSVWGLRTRTNLQNDTGAEVRAGALKLNRNVLSLAPASIAHVVAAVRAVAAVDDRATVEAVGEDFVGRRHFDADAVEQEAE